MRNASCPHCFRLIFGPVLTGLISLLDMRRRALGPDSVWLNLPFSPPEFQSISYGLFYGYWESKNVKFNRSNVRKFFWKWILKGLPRSSEKRKRKLLSCVLILRGASVHKTPWNEPLSRRSREVTAKKCTKKRDARAKLLYSLLI